MQYNLILMPSEIRVMRNALRKLIRHGFESEEEKTIAKVLLESMPALTPGEATEIGRKRKQPKGKGNWRRGDE